ncbi:hypothetical protein KAX02_02985 [candidate division WOR-3 bacterium]|nr:hypothetical protein [candidate division WOR-3 bacterium]
MTEDTAMNVAASTDDELNQAAANAVDAEGNQGEDQGTVQDDAGEGVQDEGGELGSQGDQELDAEGLPQDHKSRSDLGRKISAFHRRQDEFDDRIDRLLSVMETQGLPEDPGLQSEPGDIVTHADINKILDDREKTKTQNAQNYDKQYVASISALSSELSEQEYNEIFAEMQNITYNPSNDPARDAELNFIKAERAFLRKKVAGKKTNPLKGEKPRSALGGITNQTTVVKDATLPKLDAAGESYLNFVAREDGAESATKLHKSI